MEWKNFMTIQKLFITMFRKFFVTQWLACLDHSSIILIIPIVIKVNKTTASCKNKMFFKVFLASTCTQQLRKQLHGAING